MRKGGYRLVKVLLIGTLMTVAVPPTVDFERAHAASKTTIVRSVDDIQHILLTAMNSHQVNVTFVFKGKTKSLKTQLKQAIDQAMESDPYINYTIASYGYSYKGSPSAADVTVQLSYRETAEETAFVESRVKSVLKEIIVPGMTDHEKIKAVHDWIVIHLQYDTTLQKYTAYEGLSTGSAVCQGYSLLTYKMLKEAGIQNKIVEGTATPEGSKVSQLHAWNLVLVSGNWYHLDTTWDDPVPDQKNVIGIEYYMRSDKQMRKDHTWTKPYPAAVTLYRNTLSTLVQQGGSKASFYKQLEKDLQYHLYEQGEIISTYTQLKAKALETMEQGNKSIVFRFRGDEASMLDALQHLYTLKIKGISYNHSPFEDTGDLKVVVTWK